MRVGSGGPKERLSSAGERPEPVVAALLDACEEALAWTDAAGRIGGCNRAFERLSGRPRAACLDAFLPELLGCAGALEELFLERREFWASLPLSRAAGRLLVELRGSWVGERVIFVLRDVTRRAREDDARRRAERSLRAKTEELARSNADLQQFAYAASHDLTEPLRKIVAFGDLLRRHSAERLGPESLDFLDRMRAAAGRMMRLIEDLLAFSRVLGDARPSERVELSQALEGALDELDERLREAGASVEVDPLPVVRGHPTQLRQLFQNLIGNALKFRAKDRPSRIEIRTAPADPGFVCFQLRDNGIGFDPKYAERIFEPFARLHTRSEYDGSGIGLAICRRIMLRHGGWIAAEGRPGEGARFTVTLPTGGGP